jgi:hypothetical protein
MAGQSNSIYNPIVPLISGTEQSDPSSIGTGIEFVSTNGKMGEVRLTESMGYPFPT